MRPFFILFFLSISVKLPFQPARCFMPIVCYIYYHISMIFLKCDYNEVCRAKQQIYHLGCEVRPKRLKRALSLIFAFVVLLGFALSVCSTAVPRCRLVGRGVAVCPVGGVGVGGRGMGAGAGVGVWQGLGGAQVERCGKWYVI